MHTLKNGSTQKPRVCDLGIHHGMCVATIWQEAHHWLLQVRTVVHAGIVN